MNNREIKMLNDEIDIMAENDQKDRLALYNLDSIYKQDRFTTMKSMAIKKELLGLKYDEYQYKIDSLWIEIKKKDEVNTNKLIEITKKYGFPNNKRLKVYKAKAYFIFVHSPRNYFEQINEIVEKEYSETRMTEYEKEYIYWNSKYERKGMPPMCGENGEAIKNTN
ncbi:hypothetical protein [uncultured Flavobacterium sp.]|uniref:hypothetical protein n=1 Tax=uncultured Flavobacterium sp. TaxID=165435 RepID=UPI0030EB2055